MSMVSANGVDLHVEEVAPIGPAQGTVVLIHGMTSDSMASWFLTLAHPLAEAGMRVLLYDLRGHGHSSRPPTGYRLDDFVDDLEALLAHWAVDEPVHLFGNSFGGHDRVRVRGPAPRARWPASWRSSRRRPPPPGSPGWPSGCPGPPRPWPTRRRWRPAGRWLARRLRAASALLVRTRTSARNCRPARCPTRRAFAAITCPVLCLYGGDSVVKELTAETERLVPQSKHVVVVGQQHTLLIKAPDQVRAEVLPWLRHLRALGDPMDRAIIISNGRCGSTLLSDLIVEEPDTCSVQEFFMSVAPWNRSTEIITGPAYWRVLSGPKEELSVLFKIGVPPKEVRYPASGRFNDDLVNLPRILAITLAKLTDDPDALFDQLAPRVEAFPTQSVGAHHQAFLDLLTELTGKQRWVERSGGSSQVTTSLLENFPTREDRVPDPGLGGHRRSR